MKSARRYSHRTSPTHALYHRCKSPMLLLATLLSTLLCVASKPSSAQVNIYAAATATGSGDCSSAANACTLASAQTKLESTAGVGTSCTTPVAVNIILANNFYPNTSITLTNKDSGCNATHLVSWHGTSGSFANLSGGIQVPSSFTGASWTKVTSGTLNGVWQIQVPATNFEIAFDNHHRIYRPRLPTSGYYTIVQSYSATPASHACPASAWDSTNLLCTDRFSYTSANLSQSWSNYQNEIEIIDFQRWTSSTARLQQGASGFCNSGCDGNPTPVAIMTGSMAANNSGNLGFLTRHNYLVENIKEQLPLEPGTWYLARDTSDAVYDKFGDATHYTLNYLPATGETFTSSSVIVVAQKPQLLVASGLSNTTFTNIYFGQDNYVVPSQGYAAVQSDMGGSGGTIAAMVSCNQCNNVVFNSDLFWETSGHGLEFVGASAATPGNQVTNSTFLDIGDIAVKLGAAATKSDTPTNVAQTNLVKNNLMRSVARRFAAGGCVTVMISHDNTIENNECYDTYNAGITVGTVFGDYQPGCPFASSTHCVMNNLVQNNLLHDINQGVTFDLGAIYHSSGTDTTPSNRDIGNVIHDVSTNPNPISLADVGAAGIYVDNDSSGIDIENNLVYRVNGALFNAGTVVSGGNGYALRHHDGGSPTYSTNIINNNILGMASSAPFTRMKEEDLMNMNVTNNIFFSDLNNLATGCKAGNPCASIISESIGFACLTGPCTNYFTFGGNDYYNLASGNRIDFTICNRNGGCASSATLSHFTFAGWTATTNCSNSSYGENPCEDNGSTPGANNNPLFVNATCTNPQTTALDFHVQASSLGGFNNSTFVAAGTYSAGTSGTALQAPGGNSADVTVSFPLNVPSSPCTMF